MTSVWRVSEVKSLSQREREGAAQRRKGEDRVRTYANQPIGTVSRARGLRRNASEPERRLLRGLRESFPTLKWRHQTPVGPFHADILCFSERLVIEVDGDSHDATAEYDAGRTRLMDREGYRVRRYSDHDVMQNLEGVLASISLSLQERAVTRPVQPSGKGEDRAMGRLG